MTTGSVNERRKNSFHLFFPSLSPLLLFPVFVFVRFSTSLRYSNGRKRRTGVKLWTKIFFLNFIWLDFDITLSNEEGLSSSSRKAQLYLLVKLKPLFYNGLNAATAPLGVKIRSHAPLSSKERLFRKEKTRNVRNLPSLAPSLVNGDNARDGSAARIKRTRRRAGLFADSSPRYR